MIIHRKNPNWQRCWKFLGQKLFELPKNSIFENFLKIFAWFWPAWLGHMGKMIFSRVLREPTPRFVGPLVRWSVGPSIGPSVGP